MSKITQKLNEIRDEKANVEIDIIADEATREGFTADEQKDSQERAAFQAGKSRRNLYEELSKVGVDEGEYAATLVKVATAKTSTGKAIVRFTYRLEEDYLFGVESLRNVHINTTATDDWNTEHQTNFALRTLGNLYAELEANDDIAEVTTQNVVNHLQSQLEDGLAERHLNIFVSPRRINSQGKDMVFYTVYVK